MISQEILSALLTSHSAVVTAAESHRDAYRYVDGYLVVTPRLIEELARNASMEMLAVIERLAADGLLAEAL